MTTDVEDQLRTAYDELPVDRRGADTLARSARRRGSQRKRVRVAAGVAGGLVAATAIVTGVAVAGNAIGSGAASPQSLSPAGVHLDFSSKHPSTPTKSATSSRPTNTASAGSAAEDAHAGHNKKVAGLAGFLLPHDSQLPSGLSYGNHPASVQDGYRDSSFLVGVVTTGGGRTLAAARAQSGMLGEVDDTALNYRADGSVPTDGDTSQRSLASQITAFRTPEDAQRAVQQARSGAGPWIWVNTYYRAIPWNGVPGVDGTHSMYVLASPSEHLAVQSVGRYLIAAHGRSAQTASAGITSMIANLKKANLL